MIKINKQLCDLCGSCLSICPVDCMSLDENRMYIDKAICSECELCVRICPMGALFKISEEETTDEN